MSWLLVSVHQHWKWKILIARTAMKFLQARFDLLLWQNILRLCQSRFFKAYCNFLGLAFIIDRYGRPNLCLNISIFLFSSSSSAIHTNRTCFYICARSEQLSRNSISSARSCVGNFSVCSYRWTLILTAAFLTYSVESSSWSIIRFVCLLASESNPAKTVIRSVEK